MGRAERDPTAEVEVGLWGIIKFLLTTLLVISLTGKFVTGSWMWEAELGKWGKVSTYWPSEQRLFSEGGLARFDGRDENTPIYIALDGDVFDVSSNRRVYGPGGSYHVL